MKKKKRERETHFSPRDIYRLKVKEWKNLYHANRKKKKKAGVGVLISDKIDLKTYYKR